MSAKTAAVEDGGDRSAGKAERQEAQRKRLVERAKRTGGGERPVRLCSLGTVEVKKHTDGYHVAVTSAEGRRSFFIAPHEVEPILRDLETAIQVIRGQQ